MYSQLQYLIDDVTFHPRDELLSCNNIFRLNLHGGHPIQKLLNIVQERIVQPLRVISRLASIVRVSNSSRTLRSQRSTFNVSNNLDNMPNVCGL